MTVAPLLSAGDFYAGLQPTLRGDGLLLRPWWPSDAPAVVRAFADPGVAHWHLNTMAAAQAPGWIAERGRRWGARAGADWAVVAAEAPDAVLGRMGFHRVVPEQGLAEVAYWTMPEVRGARIAPRALTVMSEWAFRVKRMHRLELAHSVHNPASCRVAERAGFALEGVKRAELRHADGWHDMHLHARLADDPPAGGARGSGGAPRAGGAATHGR